jgi:hypothetical protein
VSADATDTAGASAQNEYHRRSERELATKHQKVADDAQWRQQIKAERPVMGRVATALTAKPRITPESQATAAWKVGAEGERRVGEVLQGVRGIEVLHDRLIPGSRANIDHLVVGPSGVFVIDAKKYTGKLEVRDKGGLFRHDPHLYVNGRDRTKTVDGVLRQVKVVRTALGDDFADVQIRGVLCFIGAKWPLMKHPHPGQRSGGCLAEGASQGRHSKRRAGRSRRRRGRAAAQPASFSGSMTRHPSKT